MFGKQFFNADYMHEHTQKIFQKGLFLAIFICVCNMLALSFAFCAGMKFAKMKLYKSSLQEDSFEDELAALGQNEALEE